MFSKIDIRILSLAITAVSFAACTSDNVGGAGEEDRAITLSYGTRSTSGDDETQFMSGETIWLWASGSTNITAWKLGTDGNGGFTSSTKYYWPKDGTTLQATAIHGNFTTPPTEGTTPWSGRFTHTVLTEQTSETNYRQSDLLYCSTPIGQWQPSNILTFEHQLAKVEVTLACASGASISDDVLANATVKLSGIKPTATFDCSTKAVTVSGTAGEVSLGKIFSSDAKIREAIVAAEQTVSPLKFTITLNNFPASGKSRTLTCSTSSVTFSKGKKYKYTLTLNNNIIVSPVTVSSWIADESTTVTIPAAPVEGN